MTLSSKKRRVTFSAFLALPLILGAAEPMMTLLDPPQLQALVNRHASQPALVFTESRDFPIRHVSGIPARWLPQADESTVSFRGEAQPGEFYLFQVAVYGLKSVGPLKMDFGALSGLGGEIPASAFRCLNLGGTNYLGQRFAKHITLKKGALQPLWVGVDVPRGARGLYTGRLQLGVGSGKTIPVSINLTVAGPVLVDHGDANTQNLSRLRWLDSTVGSEPRLTQPFTPVKTSGRTIRILGRELALGRDGLPAQITSHFSPSNTRLERTGRPLLKSPMRFIVETDKGPVKWEPVFGRLQHDALNANWTASSRGGGLRADLSGSMDYTGCGELQVRLVAEKDMDLKDARLEAPFREEAAPYFMGLNKQGGLRPAEVRWKWDVKKHQDCFWMGDINAGLMLRFKDAAYRRPAVNIYYAFWPLRLPDSWGNEGQGGVDIEPATDHGVLARAYGGPRQLKRGETLDFAFELYLTPFRTLDTAKQWDVRFIHLGGGREGIDNAVAQGDPVHGPNVVNVHHASFYCPYINYPYSDDSFASFCDLVKRAHAKDVKLRVYYTTREITQNMPELFPLHSLNGEVIMPGPGKAARTLLHPKGPHPWLVENLVSDFIPAWVAEIGPPYSKLDLSVITTPDSRWNNFYLEGLQWLCDKSDFDGVYIDDTALNAESLRRARRILDQRPGRIIDLHTWNHFNEWAGYANNLTIYMEILPYLDRLWLGEGFNAHAAPWDFWLVEMSGLPFGLMSEMLDGVDPRRGMVFGETGRLGHSGDPKGMWKVWDKYHIQGTEMISFADPNCPVKTGNPEIKATVYRKPGVAFVALGSWAKEKVDVKLTMDWAALGLDPKKATLHAPAIEKVQPDKVWQPGEAIPLDAGEGWFLVVTE